MFIKEKYAIAQSSIKTSFKKLQRFVVLFFFVAHFSLELLVLVELKCVMIYAHHFIWLHEELTFAAISILPCNHGCYFFQLSKVRCFNDFLQALKSKVEDKALVDFWEIVVQGMMAFHFLKYFYFYYSLCRRKPYVSNGTLKLNLEQHFDLGHSRSLCKRKKN